MAQIRGALVLQGCPVALADAEIAEAQASPYLQGAGLAQARLEKRDWVLRSLSRLAAMEGGLPAIPRCRALPVERFFADHYAANRPVLMEGLVDGWPARAWSFEALADRFADVEIEVQEGRERDPAYEINMAQLRVRRRLGDVVTRILTAGPSNDFYVTANNGGHNRAALADLWHDVGPIAGILAEDGPAAGYFWMGPQGTITPFHHDLTNNLLVQFVGTKRVTLAPIWETPRMRNHIHCYSQWDGPAAIAAADPADRPETVICDLAPGDALFIPVGWWHHVEALSPTIGMSFTGFARPNDHHSDYRSFGPL